MNRAIKYRAYPTTAQKIQFAKTFGCCRKVWNLMLADKIDYYKACRKSLHTTPAQYKDVYPYLREVDSLALANVQLNLQTAYKKMRLPYGPGSERSAQYPARRHPPAE